MDKTLGEPTDSQWTEMMTVIPTHKQRIAGKSIPIEKFVIAKAERSLQDKSRLPICGLVRERMMYNMYVSNMTDCWDAYDIHCLF
jgi:hypothetical protein